MGLGITKFLNQVLIYKNCIEFSFRKKQFGFDNANAFLRRIDKNSIIPILRKNGAKIGNDCDIEVPLIFHNCHEFSNLIIGDNCHIGKNCFFDLKDKILIENNVVISMNSSFITHIDLYRSELRRFFPSQNGPITIKEHTYIGASSIVLMNITINQCAFVAAGAVVNKEVPKRVMVGGVPARLLKTFKNAK